MLLECSVFFLDHRDTTKAFWVFYASDSLYGGYNLQTGSMKIHRLSAVLCIVIREIFDQIQIYESSFIRLSFVPKVFVLV